MARRFHTRLLATTFAATMACTALPAGSAGAATPTTVATATTATTTATTPTTTKPTTTAPATTAPATTTATNTVQTTDTLGAFTQAAGSKKSTSSDGVAPQLPMQKGNPYNIAVGDQVQISNFRRSDFPICFYRFFCLFTPNVTLNVTEVQDTAQGTRFRLDGFGGYMGHPIFKNGALIGVVQGSNGGKAYGYLFGTEAEAHAAQKSYRPLRTGLFSRASFNTSPEQPYNIGGSSLSSSKDVNAAPKVDADTNNADTGTNTDNTDTATSRTTRSDVLDATTDAFINSNTTPWSKQGQKYLKQVRWTPGTKTIHVDPKEEYASGSFLGGLSSLMGSSSRANRDMPINQMWQEAVNLGVPDTTSVKQQFICHAQGSAIRKSDWKLELDRPAAKSQAAMNRAACNP